MQQTRQSPYLTHRGCQVHAVASLGLASPGAATDGVTLFFS